MNKLSNIILTICIAGVISFVVAFIARPTNTIVKEVEKRVGALSGPDLPYDYFSFGGVRRYAYKGNLITGTTTVCSIQSPVATSTLESAAIRFDISSTTASYVYIGKGANTNATTTILGQAPLTANQKGTIIATTTPLDALDEDKIFAPNQFLNFGMKPTEANSIGTFSPTGVCQATWQTI